MGALTRLKNWLFAKQSDATPPIPDKFIATRFKDSAERSGLRGDRAKVMKMIENGEERTLDLPFQKEIVEAHRDAMRMPVFSEDGGAESPEHNTLDKYDPGKLKW